MRMNTRFKPNRFPAWLLAAAFVLVATTANAHELDHFTNQHDAACALHLYSGHGGALPTLANEPVSHPPPAAFFTPPVTGAVAATFKPTPPVRAPPLRS
jgi:hypothetical protein